MANSANTTVSQQPDPGTTGRILVVEDELLIGLDTMSALADAGYDVVLAGDGAEGLEVLGQQNFDLIITDYVMPKLTGSEMIRLIRKRGVTTPVVLATSVDEAALHTGRDPWFDHYVGKPYNVHALIAVVRRMIARGQEKKIIGRNMLVA